MIDFDELPLTWNARRLADLCDIRLGKTPARKNPAYWGGALPWASISDLNDSVLSATKEGITELGVRACNCKPVAPGTLLFSFKLTIGKQSFAGVPLYTNEAIAALPVKSGVELEPKFLSLALKVVPLLDDAADAAKGLTLNKDSLAAIRIPVPPLAEQRRLVARIEALTSRLEQARQARQAALPEADNLLTIAQRSEYERLLVDEETTALGEIGEVISGGTPAKSVEAYWGGDVPWIAPKEMKRFRIGESSINVTQRAVDEGAAKLVRKPAVLMVVRGMILAKRVPIAVSTRPLTINQDMKAFIPTGDLDVSFLGHMLCGAAEELQTRVEIAGHGTCKLETLAWSPLPIPVPSPAEQRRIVARLDALAAKQTELRRLQTETEALLAAFTPALLAKAFRGEL